MSAYTQAFEDAVQHAMLYEVGGHWKLTPEVEAGLCATKEQRHATGYVNDPDDAGGETKFGVAKKANPTVDIVALTWAGAKEIYYHQYWLAGKCDKLPSRLAVLHFDGCVNHGLGRAAMFLQRGLFTVPDGAIGPATLAKANQYPETKACENICQFREQFYRDIVANKPAQGKFLNGWLRRIDEMRAFVLTQLRQAA